MHECESDSELLNINILSSLSCPSCKEYLTIPVHLCSLGHSVCGTCKRRLSRCPICARKFLDGTHIRNWAVEGVIELLFYPCPNREYGCNLSCKLSDLKWHTETCPYRIYICHITDETKCSWYGRSFDLQSHIRYDHSDDVWMENGHPRIWVQDTVGCNVESQILFKEDNKFWVHRKQQDGLLCWSVQYIGPQEECVNYSFSLIVTNDEPPIPEDSNTSRMLPISSSPRNITLQAGVQPDALSPQELFENPFRYACLSVRVFKMYQDCDDNITFTIYIKEKEVEKVKDQSVIEYDEEVEEEKSEDENVL